MSLNRDFTVYGKRGTLIINIHEVPGPDFFLVETLQPNQIINLIMSTMSVHLREKNSRDHTTHACASQSYGHDLGTVMVRLYTSCNCFK